MACDELEISKERFDCSTSSLGFTLKSFFVFDCFLFSEGINRNKPSNVVNITF